MVSSSLNAVATSATQQSCAISNFCGCAYNKVTSIAQPAIKLFGDLFANIGNQGIFAGTKAWVVAHPFATGFVALTLVALSCLGYVYAKKEAASASDAAPIAGAAPAEVTTDVPASV